jgi:hypothetical protein
MISTSSHLFVVLLLILLFHFSIAQLSCVDGCVADCVANNCTVPAYGSCVVFAPANNQPQYKYSSASLSSTTQGQLRRLKQLQKTKKTDFFFFFFFFSKQAVGLVVKKQL